MTTQLYHFKIGWKFPKSKPMLSDYAAKDLRTLLTLIEESEGITTNTTEYLYIHQILPFGGVKEVLAHEAKTGSLKVDFSPTGKISRGEYPQMESEQHEIVGLVAEALKKASEESMGGKKKKEKKKDKPHIKLKLAEPNNAPTVRTFLYVASEAKSIG